MDIVYTRFGEKATGWALNPPCPLGKGELGFIQMARFLLTWIGITG
jgi:hypothetical protein